MSFTRMTSAVEKKTDNLDKKVTRPLLVLGVVSAVLLLSPAPSAHAQAAQDCFYNACSVGTICDLGEQFYSPGDYVYNQELTFPVAERKLIPQPYYEEYKDFVCKADECDSDYGDTWYCTSAIIGGTNVNRIQQCPNFAVWCNLYDCQGSTSEPPYCDEGAVRFCDSDIYGAAGYYTCTGSGWSSGGGGESGECRLEPLIPWYYCVGGSLGVPGSGRWQRSPFEFEQGRCEDMLVELTAGMTPGYIKTYTPYLNQIWNNTVASAQAIFSIFRTQLDKPVYDWPGESTIAYTFTPYEGTGFATAGFPPMIHAGWDAKIYFRYLGYIHCAKENLLQKLSSVFHDPPYIYYDSRCDTELW